MLSTTNELNFTRAPQLSSSSTLYFGLSDAASTDGYGQLSSQETLNLAGYLGVGLEGAWVPQTDDNFELITTPTQGRFQHFITPNPLLTLGYDSENQVVVKMAEALSYISRLQPTMDGFNQLEIRGIPGTSYTIEVSLDLDSWIILESVALPPEAVMIYIDPTSLDQPYSFYRLRFEL